MALVVHLALRIWLLTRGNFYWDDLVLVGRASTHSLWSWSYLGHDHDGHFMPAAFLVAGVCTQLAPLSWPLAATSLLIGQLVAAVAVARMLVVIAGRVCPAVLAAWLFFLFTPMTVPAFAWWAAGINSLPMQAGLAWIIADAVLVARGRRTATPWMIVRSVAILLVACAFFEKSMLIVPAAIAFAVLATPDRRAAVRRSMRLWFALVAAAVVWGVIYLVAAGSSAGWHPGADHSPRQTVLLLWRTITHAVAPAMVGGPWRWDRWNPSPPMGFAPTAMIVLGVLVLLVIGVYALSRRGGAAVLVVTLVYFVCSQVPPLWNRSGPDTALELAQTLRYLPDVAVVAAAALVLILISPPRTGQAGNAPVPTANARVATASVGEVRGAGRRTDVGAILSSPAARVGAGVAALVLVASSVVGTVGFTRAWHDNPTGAYLSQARTSLAENASVPMFDQPLPLEVLLPIAYPDNQISHVFGLVRDRPVITDHADRLQVLDPSGRMVPGAITPARSFSQGRGRCDRPEVTGPSTIALDGPLARWTWTAQIPYCATADGRVEVRIGDSDPVVVPVRAGLHPVWVQATGAGGSIRLRPLTPGLSLHIGSGRVGEVVMASLLH
ncbi:hypothetical protein GCM10027169_35850 [Gordonia jinhuaensis]|uniref:Uncharacterized protein n=1 Tax=Gordonia jinhuaensis TaxID=1517702 RepID=A0A916WU07_9ACTN|nr:hypothetical protein GCM10011489_17280 [Gordonia jinhuaensis]